jgi:general stress protein YciG
MVMAPKEGRGSSGMKGFASMDDERKREIAKLGGQASAKAKKTSNRGFASMDKKKQREISSMGGRASKGTAANRPEENEKDAERKGIIRERNAPGDLNSSLEEEDNLESEETQDSLSYSETDVDEDEGVGDGNLGRSSGSLLGK